MPTKKDKWGGKIPSRSFDRGNESQDSYNRLSHEIIGDTTMAKKTESQIAAEKQAKEYLAYLKAGKKSEASADKKREAEKLKMERRQANIQYKEEKSAAKVEALNHRKQLAMLGQHTFIVSAMLHAPRGDKQLYQQSIVATNKDHAMRQVKYHCQDLGWIVDAIEATQCPD